MIFLAFLSESSSSISLPTIKSRHKPLIIANQEGENTFLPNAESRHNPLTIANQESQDSFYNKSQYGVVMAFFCQDHNLN